MEQESMGTLFALSKYSEQVLGGLEDCSRPKNLPGFPRLDRHPGESWGTSQISGDVMVPHSARPIPCEDGDRSG